MRTQLRKKCTDIFQKAHKVVPFVPEMFAIMYNSKRYKDMPIAKSFSILQFLPSILSRLGNRAGHAGVVQWQNVSLPS